MRTNLIKEKQNSASKSKTLQHWKLAVFLSEFIIQRGIFIKFGTVFFNFDDGTFSFSQSAEQPLFAGARLMFRCSRISVGLLVNPGPGDEFSKT